MAMKKLSREAYREIRDWMYRNARPIDLALWRFRFEGGRAEDVLTSLQAYQNADGGFGHAIDCDNWNPNSAPFGAGVAIGIFAELHMLDPAHKMVGKMLGYLGETEFYSPEVGWHFTVPTNDGYPHAPWWSYSEENNRANGFHATGALAGYILRCGDKKSAAYARALEVSRAMADKILSWEARDMHEVGAYAAWLAGARAASLHFDFDAIAETVHDMVNETIERDPAKWPFYSMRPSQYIDGPSSPYYRGNENAMEAELDYILDTRDAGGVWDISWRWEAHPSEFAIARRWWQGNKAASGVALLKAFGRVEG
jgi:hypothetical protein